MRRLGVVALALALAACGNQAGSGPSTSPHPTVASVPPGAEQEWGLRYRLLDHYTNAAYCDPDSFPVQRVGGERSNADAWWPHNRGKPEARAILAHRRYSEPLDAQQRLTAYRDHKELTVIEMTANADGDDFTLSISTADQGYPDTTVKGTISNDGSIVERSRTPRAGGCPICLEGVTRIATPRGPVEVRLIHVGDVVYSIDGSGHRVRARVVRIARRATPGPHLMVRLALADGRVLIAAGAHPAADGRLLRDLRAGARYDRSTIASIGFVESSAVATYDILPAGSTGDYWANGILVGSTL